MKKYIWMLLLLLVAGTLFAQGSKVITVTGHVKFPDPTGKRQIYLGQMKGEGFKKVFTPMDSAVLDNKQNFQFKINTAVPDFYQIRVYYMDRIDIWADKDDLTINFRGIDTAKVIYKNPPYIMIEGSADNNVINLVNFASHRNYQGLILSSRQKYEAQQAKDSLWMKSADLQLEALTNDMNERIRNIVQLYGDRPTVLYALRSLNWKTDHDLMMATLDRLSKKYPDWATIEQRRKEILANMEQTKKLAIGNPVPTFSLSDPSGKKISPEQLRGKYLILDFWASWCGPCRGEIPHLKDIYSKYRKEGLQIMGVSIDAKESDWRKALLEENMPWHQVLAKDSRKLMNDYLFNAIPYMVIVDPKGNIVETNLRGEALTTKLKSIFGY
ncbi:MAG: TlpA family protein disulfide reductase [Sphingobacterium sp.]|jgi:peroxiredoxin|nr:TlpA family protein disulfide reductase [Sphingobacterium sp.]